MINKVDHCQQLGLRNEEKEKSTSRLSPDNDSHDVKVARVNFIHPTKL